MKQRRTWCQRFREVYTGRVELRRVELRRVRYSAGGAVLGVLLSACDGEPSPSARPGVSAKTEAPTSEPEGRTDADAEPNAETDDTSTDPADDATPNVDDASTRSSEGSDAEDVATSDDVAASDDVATSDDDTPDDDTTRSDDAATSNDDVSTPDEEDASPSPSPDDATSDDEPPDTIDEAEPVESSPQAGPTPRGTPAETRAALVVNETALCSGLEPEKLVVAGMLEDHLFIGDASGQFRDIGPVFEETGLALNMATSKDGEKVFISAPYFAEQPTHFAVYDAVEDELFSAVLSEEMQEDLGPARRGGAPSYAVPHSNGVTLVRGDGSWTNAAERWIVSDVVELDESGWYPVLPLYGSAYYDFEQGGTRQFAYDARSDVSSFTMVDGKAYYLAVMDGAEVFSLVEEGPSNVEVFQTNVPTEIVNDTFGALSTFVEVVEDVVIVRSEGYPRLIFDPGTREVQSPDYLLSYDYASLSLSLPWVLVDEAGRPTEIYDIWTGEGRAVDVDPAITSTSMHWEGDWFMGEDESQPLWLLNVRTGEFETIELDESFETKVTWETCSPPPSIFDVQTFPQSDGTILTTLRDQYQAGAYQRRRGDNRWRRVGRAYADVFSLNAQQWLGPVVQVYGTSLDVLDDPNVGVCSGYGGGEYEDDDQTGLLTAEHYQMVIPGEAPVVLRRNIDGVNIHPSGLCMQVYAYDEGNEGVDLMTRARIRFDFEAITWL